MGTRLREIIGRGPDSKVGIVGSRERSGETLDAYSCLNLSLVVEVNQGSCLYGALALIYLFIKFNSSFKT